MAQLKMQELPSKFKVAVHTALYRVEAPLPPDFGFTVGSEYTTPFDIGNISGGIQKLYAVGGLSNPVGLRMRKMYANPEPTEISFDMEFAAYHSAKEDVVVPMVTLMLMSLGRVVKAADVSAAVEKFGRLAASGASLFGFGEESVNNATTTASETLNDPTVEANTSRLLEMINLISAPEVCSISFGDFLEIDKAYITSTAVSFSNVLDRDGYPMSGKVSVTATVQVAPIADDISKYFGQVVGVRR